ncbi:GLPGLI family protein [Kaistella palustris]|uniref:GLPGLI family protein n=1 Tax=Kaistella palustris TaxID=493376 RepID=UPI00041B4D5E|nr:GLPGLI family protein [Kaistella palustris]
MMKILVAFSLFFGLMVFAQQNRVIYEYTYRPDSTKTDSLKKEWMYLDINKNGSKYYSKSTFESDSIVAESVKKQMEAGMQRISVSRQSSGGEIKYEITKTYPAFKTTLITNIGNDTYEVPEDRPISWQILPAKKKLGEFAVQEARTHFAGRNWTAWFTTDIAIQDGPYKFSGLPGLIVEISDESGSHKMELKGIKKIPESTVPELNTKGRDIPLLKKKPLEISRQQYVKQLRQYANDPVQSMREILAKPNSQVKINVNGREISDPKDILRELEKNAREKMQKNNNPLELIP